MQGAIYYLTYKVLSLFYRENKLSTIIYIIAYTQALHKYTDNRLGILYK